MVVTIFTTIMGPMMTSSLAALVTRSFTVRITTATILTGITRTDIILTDIIRTATAAMDTAAMDTAAMDTGDTDTGDTDMDTILTINPVIGVMRPGEDPRFGKLRCVWRVQAITAESWVLERVMQPDLTNAHIIRA
jgi:hypothetical protein